MFLCRSAIVYKDRFTQATKEDFISLAPFQIVDGGVVDAWCSYLNIMEGKKAPTTAARLFFSTSPAVSVSTNYYKLNVVTYIN